MRWQDLEESSSVEDRRGMGRSGGLRTRGGIPLRGKTGLAVVIVVLVAGYYGIDLTRCSLRRPSPAFLGLSRCRGNRSKACFPGRKERKGGLSCLTARQSDRLHRTVQTVPGRRATVFSVRFRGKIRSPGADGERRVGTACQNAVDFRDHDVRRHRLEAHV